MAQVIQYDYDFSPYGQKTRLLLHAAGVDFAIVDVPAVLPRPDLEKLGITYRRIPVIAIGKDIYADSSIIIDQILAEHGKLPRNPADKAYEVFGANLFSEILSLIPMQVLTPDFVKDRSTIFPSLGRSDLKTLRPSGLAQFKARLAQIETQFLSSSSGPFINGSQLGLADIHVVWPINWALNALGLNKEPGLDASAFPKLFKLLNSLPTADEIKSKAKLLSADEAHKIITGAQYTSKTVANVQDDNTYGIAAGTTVAVESFDSTPGSHPQYGKLIGTSIDEAVIETDGGVRIHFPRIGYLIRTLEDAPAKPS
ncbi:Putative glutathione S-transferase, Thioredoxin-like superfamily [Septoria linicola]|uniref:Glutathione S-transferase, Thioredoxin-like superfamily n=1 Tax=Septoria linicola TaxID=215465 RepID=A0A9Q9B2J5_9PEZI|nr:Putative glutathione S-transferase, Thioredoxin-like superfamily [Septoria linicola]